LGKTCLCCKSMLMISSLDQPIKIFVKSLEIWWQMSLRCPWLDSLVTFLLFKSSK
jgi:hypothetical protein